MSEENGCEVMETIDEIVREMRIIGSVEEKSTDQILSSFQSPGLRMFAARIEAAAKRERAATSEKSSAVGDVAAMREALEFAEYELCAHGLFVASKLVKSALSAPPRNCDVGTVDAQVSRYNKFCMQRACSECPFYVASDLLACGVRWAQTPCEEA